MQTITLIQFWISSHTVKKEWIKNDLMSRCKRGIDRIEVLYVIRSHIARCAHPGEQDSNVTIAKLA